MAKSKVLRELIEEIRQEQERRVAFPYWGNWRNWRNWRNWHNWQLAQLVQLVDVI